MTAVLRDTIRTALHDEWWRSIREKIEDAPDGHVDRLTDAIMRALDSESIALPLDDARRLFDLATDSPLVCSGSFETDDVVVLRRLAQLIGVDPNVATPDEFAAQYPHPFKRRPVFAEMRYNETPERARERIAEERDDPKCQVGTYGRRCWKLADDPIHTAEMGA